jgi:hypothetical protein
MKRRIVGYHVNAEVHWVAELECGHQQHVRHSPPFAERRVTTEERRASRLGQELNCVECDGAARKGSPWRLFRARDREMEPRERRKPPTGSYGDPRGVYP